MAFISTSCTQNSPEPENDFYGDDAAFYNALAAIQDNDTEKANLLLAKAIEKGSTYVSRRSLEITASTGNIQDRLKYCNLLVKKYGDEDAMLFAAKEYFADKEFSSLISMTENIDYKESSNELIKYRLMAMMEKQDSRLAGSICAWFTSRRISGEHISFYNIYNVVEPEPVEGLTPILEDSGDGVYRELQNDDGTENAGLSPSEKAEKQYSEALNKVLTFRLTVYRGRYGKAFEQLPEIKDICLERKVIPMTYQLAADMGRACLNGSSADLKNAAFFNSLAEMNFPNDISVRYYAWIYAALIYNKTDKYRTRAMNRFNYAMECSSTDNEYDMALWYYLNAKLKEAPEAAVDALEKYSSTWHDAAYFSDFFDSLSVLLFSSGKWKSFIKICKIISDCNDKSLVAKFSYLSARLIQSGYARDKDFDCMAAYQKAAESAAGTDVYYRLLAAKQMDYTVEQMEELFFNGAPAQTEAVPERDADAEKLLLGYADFGFHEKIFSEWTYFYTRNKYAIGLDTVVRLATFLRSLATPDNDYYYKSLQMVAKTVNLPGIRITKDAFMLAYPQNFHEQVAAYAAEFSVDEYVMYGLIRTESFFEPRIQSHAGATGLTQLMETTAADCAKKLGLEEYDLTDAATNIRLGTYYFSDLVRRLNGSQIRALFAYNAGITRVRKWIQSSRIELEVRGLHSDLFLETLPFEETREYGRKVISAAAMYGWLYYGQNPCDIANTMM